MQLLNKVLLDLYMLNDTLKQLFNSFLQILFILAIRCDLDRVIFHIKRHQNLI